ncbi:MAG: hypothetical protein MJ107_00605 [Lachnospiraceae bacterium]|nr:hypothetical protein [Lachnospiraceae bacterium]
MEKEKKKISLNMILALVIAGIVIFCGIKLYLWNNSGKDVVMEDVEDGAYDYESLDVVFTVDKEILENHGFDNINTILCIGNEVLTAKPEGTSLADIISTVPDSEMIVLSAYGTKVADAANCYNTNDVSVWQSGNLYDIIKALCYKDYSLQERALAEDAIISKDYYNTLISIDMDKIDTLFIMYDSVDYMKGSALYNPDDKFDTSYYEGAYRAAITTVQQMYPHIKIVIGSPYLHATIVGDNVMPVTVIDNGVCNLSEYVMRQYNIAMETCVSYDDNFFGLITEETMNYYCNVDALNLTGIELIGNHIKEFLERDY